MRRAHFYKLFVLLGFFWAACPAPDVTPVYFPSQTTSANTNTTLPPPPVNASCKLALTEATLCVVIKGDKFDAGGAKGDPLCVPVAPIPFQIDGETFSLKGDSFPDITVEGHGLPVPITINGKGDTDGTGNVGEGTWSPAGDIQIDHFTFYVNALGTVGEIPAVTLTTGATDETPPLGILTGQPADSNGVVKLVGATVLGHLFDATDKILKGAALSVAFSGTLSPALADCANASGAKETEVIKLRTDPSGAVTEEPLPNNNRLEISQGTYIAQGPQDVGSAFEATAQFKITATGSKTAKINIPAQIGPFFLDAQGKTQFDLPAKGSFLLQATFRPTHDNVKPGEVIHSLRLGADLYQLVGVALAPQGKTTLDILNEAGNALEQDAQGVHFQDAAVPANTIKHYFRCQTITCDAAPAATACEPCNPPDTGNCTLHPIDSNNHPIDAVNKACQAMIPNAVPQMTIDLSGAQSTTLKPSKQVLSIRNRGTTPLVIKNISIEEMIGSKSTGEFQLPPQGIYLATHFQGIAEQNVSFPVTLPPYHEGVEETSLYLVITYLPNDLTGVEGDQAVSGKPVWDRATLKIVTGDNTQEIHLAAKTSVLDIPELQTYFATATGLKAKSNNQVFSFREVTSQTTDTAVPVFLKLADNAQTGLRINKISVEGANASFFEWLDTADKINGRQPASGAGKRCSIPILDPSNNRMVDEKFDLKPVSLAGNGFDLKPGSFTLESLLESPFGCINFHRDIKQTVHQRIFSAALVVSGIHLDAAGKLERNTDGSFKETTLHIPLLAAIDPLHGKYVLRVSQTIASFLNPEFPGLTAMGAKKELEQTDPSGTLTKKESAVLMGALILDPFDEETISDEQGNVVSKPNDGVTLVFRPVDTHPVSTAYEQESLFDYASLMFDNTLIQGKQGIYFDYPNVPPNTKTASWRIFTGSLSYPGPLKKGNPTNLNGCDVIDPCSPEGLGKFTDSGAVGGRGACAFFYASAGDFSSPSFQNRADLCKQGDKPQDLTAPMIGQFNVDGSLFAENMGLRFWGPTYFHNPSGPLGNRPPLDDVLHITFTTEMLKPQTDPQQLNVLPDTRINFNKLEHKINLTEKMGPEEALPPICTNNIKNRVIGGNTYSTWKYFKPLLFKDDEGKIPAGCKEPDNDFTEGTAFLRGRRIDPDTRTFTIVTAAKFDDREELTLALKNVMIFVAINGWLCDPNGSKENFEGATCYDQAFNDRDAKAQISIMDE